METWRRNAPLTWDHWESQTKTSFSTHRKFFIISSCPILVIFVLTRVAECYEYAMLPEHMNSPDPTVGVNSITETGALCISSGSKAGRVPKQKRIVEDDITRDVSIQLIRNLSWIFWAPQHNTLKRSLLLFTEGVIFLYRTWLYLLVDCPLGPGQHSLHSWKL